MGSRQGINLLLAVLVFATATTVSIRPLGRVRGNWSQLAAALAIGAVALPALSWLAARLVAAGSLRNGVMAIGLAPCETASVAMTGLAGGDVPLAAEMLVGSTAISVVAAGPILSLEAPGAHVHAGHILLNLVLVVAVPLTAGMAVRATAGATDRREAIASRTATGALVGLVALVAAQTPLGLAYLAVLPAIVVIVIVSAAIGTALARTTTTAAGTPLLLAMSVRDFAIAAALATSAFGPAAASPLGLYGVVVIVWGTAVAGRVRARNRRSGGGEPKGAEA